METDRLRLREILASSFAGIPATEVHIDLSVITDPQVLEMTIEEIKHCFGKEIKIELIGKPDDS